jgi:hypothetical protein
MKHEEQSKLWSDKFNELPTEIRTIGAAMECQTRIQHLKMEKRRLKSAYQKSCAEINDHLKNCEKNLNQLTAITEKL